jgi:soluble lytic murein transglycosylase
MRFLILGILLFIVPLQAQERIAGFDDIEPAAGPALRENYVLNSKEVKASRAAFAAARRGNKPDMAQVPAVLQGYVEAAYLLGAHKSTASELNAWLRQYPELAVAGDVYELAEARRAKPRQECATKTIKPKPTAKNKKPKARKKRTCKTVGSYGPQPPKTAAMLAREARQEAAQNAQERRRTLMSTQGRALSSQVWRLRSRGDYKGAMNVLLENGSRMALGGSVWQEELVRIADFYHGKRMWPETYRAASAAAQADGATRDEALWLAGFASYRMNEKERAATYWQRLVREEPVNGNHYGRAAWWAARVLSDMGESRAARSMLEAGAKAPLTFYGQLAAMRLGREAMLDFNAPGVDTEGLDALLANRQARAGLALAQLGEYEWAEAELRAATPNLPLSANRALAGIAVTYDLHSTALRAGRDLLDDGNVVGAALFPLPHWKPQGGWQYDKAMMIGLMRQESAFQPTIGSRVGAQGLMQIMPATGRYIAGMTGRSYRGTADLHTPSVNLAMAQDYLNYLSQKLEGNKLFVAAAYNGGIGNVRRWVANGVTPDSDPMLWVESIPFDETRDYVEKIMFNTWAYQQRLGQPRTSLKALAENKWPK